MLGMTFKSPSRQWKQPRMRNKSVWRFEEAVKRGNVHCSMNLNKNIMNLRVFNSTHVLLTIFLILSPCALHTKAEGPPWGAPGHGEPLTNTHNWKEDVELHQQTSPSHALLLSVCPSWRWGIWQTIVTCVNVLDPRRSVQLQIQFNRILCYKWQHEASETSEHHLYVLGDTTFRRHAVSLIL